MREFPIIFSESMVRAILEGRKTMTRRLASKPWLGWHEAGLLAPPNGLWGREAHVLPVNEDKSIIQDQAQVFYAAGASVERLQHWRAQGGTFRSSIHMPRWASRLTLPFTAESRVERLQEIDKCEAVAEGALEAVEIPYIGGMTFDQARDAFSLLWNSLHKPPFAWEDNPEVIVLMFERKQP